MKNKDVVIIMPAYNESGNIFLVVKGIRKTLPDVKLIVIDDSVKKENEKTKKALKNFKNIEFISRYGKLGRGSAVLEGFKKGLSNKNVKYFFEMDSDLAHDATKLTSFLDKIKEHNAGMVIGSRYIEGGEAKDISLARTLLSKLINKFLSIMLDIKLTDYTSGFRLYSRKAVDYLTKANLKSTGFITLSEITYKLNKKGFKIEEVPVVITKRKYGKSTMGIRELTVSLKFVLMMKLEDIYLEKIKK